MLLWSWAAITLFNWAVTLILWRRRQHDHPWVCPFFGLYASTDLALWIISPSRDGGLNLLGPGVLGYPTWIAVVSVLWMSWSIAPLFAVLRVHKGRVHPAWIVATVSACALIAISESFGLSCHARRFLMSMVFAPVVLVTALAYIGVYLAKTIGRGGRIEFLVFAAMFAALLLLVKLVMLMTPALLLKRWQSHVVYYFFMTTNMLAYFGIPRLRRWLLLR